ncbi:hypothetical protein GE21DRAFT_1080575 [Neurospora crassa]|nr:hypothetical protein GE21DRAFT_1080575 [Neurospora crassa]
MSYSSHITVFFYFLIFFFFFFFFFFHILQKLVDVGHVNVLYLSQLIITGMGMNGMDSKWPGQSSWLYYYTYGI